MHPYMLSLVGQILLLTETQIVLDVTVGCAAIVVDGLVVGVRQTRPNLCRNQYYGRSRHSREDALYITSSVHSPGSRKQI